VRMMSMYFTGVSLVREAADASFYYPCRTGEAAIDIAREVLPRGRSRSRPIRR